MRSKKQSGSQSIWTKLKGLISHPVLSGLVTIISLIAMARSDDVWIRVPSALIAIGFGVYFLFVIRELLRSIAIWLTWKFVLGLVLGVVVGAIAMPLLFQPIFSNVLTITAPKITVVDTFPVDGGTLIEAMSGISVRFSEPIPYPYYKFVEITIEPDHPISVIWDNSSHQSLAIMPNKIYPLQESNFLLNPRFEYGTTYYLTINAPVLESPVRIEIHSPSQ